MYEELLEDLISMIREGFRTFKKVFTRRIVWLLRLLKVKFTLDHKPFRPFCTSKLYQENVFVWNKEECMIVRK